MTEPLNFLVIISDEHRKDAMGCAGHKIVQTPNLDRLAARGTRFTSAYTACPMCVPTRAALATGQCVHETGHWDSATPYSGAPNSWMHRLREAGRNVTSIGKLHFRSTDDDNGFSEEILPMHVVGGVGWLVGLLRDDPPTFDAAAELAADVGTGASSYTDYDRVITAKAVDWLQDPARRTQPWAAFVSLVSPHYPLTCPEDWARYRPEDMPLPVAHRKKPDHPEIGRIVNFFDYDRHFNEQGTKEAVAAYFGLTSFMDDCVGRVLAALSASGQADNTVVLYLSDHGEMLGDQGLWTKQVLYEASAGIPMILAGPGVPAGREVATCVNITDVAATAREVSGLGRGGSLREIAAAPYDSARTGFSEYHDGGSSTGGFMVRWADWKFIHYEGARPQLFNLVRDPNELNNLAPLAADSTEVRNALTEGRERLLAICDPGQVNDQAFADQRQKIAYFGGVEACRTAFVFNHTPVPNA